MCSAVFSKHDVRGKKITLIMIQQAIRSKSFLLLPIPDLIMLKTDEIIITQVHIPKFAKIDFENADMFDVNKSSIFFGFKFSSVVCAMF